MTVPSALTRKHGSRSILLQTEYNALVELAKGDRALSSGIADEMAFGNYDYDLLPEKDGIMVFSAAEIPIYSVFCLKPDPDEDRKFVRPLYLEVEQPDEKNQQVYFTNSESGAYGYAAGTGGFACLAELMSGHKIYRLKLFVDEVEATLPRPGFPCGVRKNTFEIDGDGVGFICVAVDEPNNFVYATLAPAGQRFLCKPHEAIPTGEIGEVFLWRGPPGAEVEVDPEAKYKACNRTSAEISADKFAEMVTVDGKAYVVPWECAPETGEPPVTPSTAIDTLTDNFDRTIGDDIGVGAPATYVPILGSSLSDFTIQARSGSDHCCRMTVGDSGVVSSSDVTTTSSADVMGEIESFGLIVGDEVGPILSYLDDNNYYSVFGSKVTGTTYSITITRVESGTPTVLATSTITLPPGTQFWVVGKINFGTGFISGYVRDEMFIKSAIIETEYVPNGGNKAGFGTGTVSGAYTEADNFKIEETHVA